MTVTIRDTRSGNRSCDWSGDLSPTFSEFVYVCLCLFTYVWSLDLFWKLYIVPTLRDLLPLASISTSIPSYYVTLSEVDPVTGGPAYMLSPSLPLGSHIRTMGELIITASITSQVKATCPCLLPYHSLDF